MKLKSFLVGLILLIPSSVSAVSCGLSDNATNTLNTACVIDGPPFTEGGTSYYSGISNGDMVVSGADITVSPGVTMTWSPGKAIMIQNGGRIIRGANAILKQVDPMAWFRQQLGFDTYAAGVPVKILGQNLHICTADPCTVTGPSGGGSLVVENSIKFGDGTTQTTAAVAAAETSGQIAAFETSCPSGWTEYTAGRGRVIVGMPLSGTSGGTVGTALTNLQDPTHTHSVDPASTATNSQGAHTHTGPSHTHTYTDVVAHTHTLTNKWGNDGSDTTHPMIASNAIVTTVANTDSTGVATGTTAASGTGATSSDGAHTHSVDIAAFNSAATSATMPYLQLLWCKKN